MFCNQGGNYNRILVCALLPWPDIGMWRHCFSYVERQSPDWHLLDIVSAWRRRTLQESVPRVGISGHAVPSGPENKDVSDHNRQSSTVNLK